MTLCGWNGPSAAGRAGPSSRRLMAKAAAAAPAMGEARLTARHATNHRTRGVMASPRPASAIPAATRPRRRNHAPARRTGSPTG